MGTSGDQAQQRKVSDLASQNRQGHAALGLLLLALPFFIAGLAMEMVWRSASRHDSGMEQGIRLDLNRASEAELQLLPGVGPALAGKIVRYRQNAGPLRTLQEAQAIVGVGPKLIRRWEPHVLLADEPLSADR